MQLTDPELSRALAVRAIRGGLLRLKWLAAATRFEIAMRRHDRALRRACKANFNPNQPRVPRGQPEGGQWMDGEGTAGNGRNDPSVLSDASSIQSGRASNTRKTDQGGHAADHFLSRRPGKVRVLPSWRPKLRPPFARSSDWTRPGNPRRVCMKRWKVRSPPSKQKVNRHAIGYPS